MPATKKKYKDADWLREMYIERELTMLEIANKSGVGEGTIHRWLKKKGIQSRNRGSNGKKSYKKESFLKEHYVIKGKSAYKIAEEQGVSPSVILYWLNKNNIERRDSHSSETQSKSQEEFINEFNEKARSYIEPIEKYQGANTRIQFKCNKCGNIWRLSPSNILQSSDCPKCRARKRTQSTEEYAEAISDFPVEKVRE